MFEVTGLTALREDELTNLLKFLHRDEIELPLTIETLTRIGLQHRHDVVMGALRGLDRAGVRAVLVCVLAERRHKKAEAPALSVVDSSEDSKGFLG